MGLTSLLTPRLINDFHWDTSVRITKTPAFRKIPMVI
jgi:hypothetical protein